MIGKTDHSRERSIRNNAVRCHYRHSRISDRNNEIRTSLRLLPLLEEDKIPTDA